MLGKAAQYLRMSTEEQEYSIEQQRAIIARYADANGFAIIRTYADEGKSGLRLKGRAGLQRLLVDVAAGSAGFEVVLVLDVTRWGRFQDADEAAHYEFICRQAGINVHYCAEIFNNDGSPQTALLKTMKRAMAAEFSRELAAKVRNGQALQIKEGYWQGGRAGFGLRRALVDSQQIMRSGERKALRTDKTILIPGPQEEVDLVRRIFDLCARGQYSPNQIAGILNADAKISKTGRSWNAQQITRLLQSDKYHGAATRNRTIKKLGTKATQLPQTQWITNPAAFQPIVSRELFHEAQLTLERQSAIKSDDQYLRLLEELWRQHGRLSRSIVNAARGVPSSSSFAARFGSMREAYAKIGYVPNRSYRYLENRLTLRLNGAAILNSIAKAFEQHAFDVSTISDDMVIIVDDRLALSVEPIMRVAKLNRRPYWKIHPKPSPVVTHSIFLMMAGDCQSVECLGLSERRDCITRPIKYSGCKFPETLRVFASVACLYDHLLTITP